VVRRRFAAAALVGMAVAGWPGPALAADQGPYPVWWSPALGFDSLEDIDRRLDEPLWNNLQGGIALEMSSIWRTRRAVAGSCRSLQKLTDEGYKTDSRNGAVIVEAHLHHCRAIEALGRARPARVSFVRSFVMDRNAVDHLPSRIAHWTCESLCQHVYTDQVIDPWRHASNRPEAVEEEDETTIKVLDHDEYFRVRLMGRADFDGDGVEDLMVMISSWRTEQRWWSTSRFVLTRHGPGEVLRILDFDAPDCARSACDSIRAMPPGAK
jgi:hypothetical protein